MSSSIPIQIICRFNSIVYVSIMYRQLAHKERL